MNADSPAAWADYAGERFPELHSAVIGFRDAALTNHCLTRKQAEFIAVAAFASACSLYDEGVRRHVVRALAAGATPGEVADVLCVISPLGMHAFSFVPAVLDEFETAGRPVAEPELGKDVLQTISEIKAGRGYWGTQRERVSKYAQGLFPAYVRLSEAPWDHGELDDVTRELMMVAIDCSAAHMYEPGLRVHVRNAIARGASFEQIMAVFQIVAALGVDGYMMGVRALAESAEGSDKEPRP